MKYCISLLSIGQQKTGYNYNIQTKKTNHTVVTKQKTYSYGISTIWENTYGFAEHYICSTSLYLLSVLSQDFYIIIDGGIS